MTGGHTRQAARQAPSLPNATAGARADGEVESPNHPAYLLRSMRAGRGKVHIRPRQVLAQDPLTPEEQSLVAPADSVTLPSLPDKLRSLSANRKERVFAEWPFRNQAAAGKGKPCFLRDTTAGGSSGRIACRRRYFVCDLRNRNCLGRRRMNSTSSISRKGQRTSSEFHIPARSIFASIPSCR